MGMRPCELHGTRYVGPANHVYPAIVAGSDRIARRWSCCAACFQRVLDWAEVHLDQVTEDNGVGKIEETDMCPSCAAVLGDDHILLFLTVYRSHQPRRDFYGRAHPACQPDVEARMGITPFSWQERLPGAA